MAVASAAGEPGDDLLAGRYRNISELGAGGMGVTYRAWDHTTGVPVVIKIPKKAFLEDPKFAERFYREIRLLQGLGHPHIVPFTDVGEHEGLPFVAMRFLPGGSLSNRRLRDKNGKVRQNPPGMLHLWLPAVADALDFVHSQGVVHRDVKPANIFFDAFWGAFLGDFGIAKIVEESDTFDTEYTLTATHMGIGTPQYMAPEQFAPKSVIQGRVDQYALAVIVYEMMAGVRPFTGESANLILEVMTHPAPRLNERHLGLPPSLIAAVDRGLAKQPEERFATCRDFAAAVLADVQPLKDEPGVARLLCPKCMSLLKLPESAAGRTGKCPKCQTAMKVAADLGAMWLLDEARRQEEAGGGWTALGDSAAGGESGSDPSVETLRPVSGTTAIEKAARRSSQGILAWVDGHGLVVGGVLALVATIPWILPAIGPGPQPSAEDKATIQRLQREKQETAKHFAELTEREKSLQKQLDVLSREVQKLQAELAVLRTTPLKEPAVPRLPSDLPEKVDAANLPADKILSLPPLKNSIGVELKLIPAGTLQMGSDDGQKDEMPAHQVRITKPFYIGVYEVTVAQWKAIMGSVPSYSRKEDASPVGDVSWDDAIEFCQKLSALPEERKAGRVYRLPTEAEWEYSCRAGTSTRYSFGEDEAKLGEYAWVQKNSDNQTHSVGQKKPNAWGLYDMHGNVWEWCSDWWGNYGSDAVTDPQGPSRGHVRVVRGGSWGSASINGNAGSTDREGTLGSSPSVGFRLVMSLSSAGTDQPPSPILDRGTL